jgi:molybdopterin-containing oxidoreductase family iron-sulfur binding subunit
MRSRRRSTSGWVTSAARSCTWRPVAANADRGDDLAALKQEMDAGQVEMLVILGSNPVYTAPADLKFAEALLAKSASGQDNVPLRVHVGLYQDETAYLCHWHVPESHWLEAWGDIRGHDGTVSVVQPLIAPLYDSRSHIEIVNVLLGSVTNGYDAVRGFHQKQRRLKDADMEHFWQRTLNEGVIRGTQATPLALRVTGDVAGALGGLPAPAAGEDVEIVFRHDPTVWDGRYANNAWLQEMNKPLSKIVWDNAALMSLATATRLGLTNEDAAELTLGPNKVVAPVWIVPGHPDNVVTAYLGYGRTRAGSIGNGTGFNAYALRTTAAPYHAPGLRVAKTGRWPGALATTEFTTSLTRATKRLTRRMTATRSSSMPFCRSTPASLRAATRT